MQTETLDSLADYWNSHAGSGHKVDVDEELLDRKLDLFIAHLEDKVFPGKLVRTDDSWWDLESSLYREYHLLEDEVTWCILICRWQCFITSLPEDDERSLDHPSVIECSTEYGFRYVPCALLSGQTPGATQCSWRSALFSEA